MKDPVRETYSFYKEDVEEEDGTITVMYLPIFQRICRGISYITCYPLTEPHDKISELAENRDEMSGFRIVRNL